VGTTYFRMTRASVSEATGGRRLRSRIGHSSARLVLALCLLHSGSAIAATAPSGPLPDGTPLAVATDPSTSAKPVVFRDPYADSVPMVFAEAATLTVADQTVPSTNSAPTPEVAARTPPPVPPVIEPERKPSDTTAQAIAAGEVEAPSSASDERCDHRLAQG
jgi:hypothetical protein